MHVAFALNVTFEHVTRPGTGLHALYWLHAGTVVQMPAPISAALQVAYWATLVQVTRPGTGLQAL